MIGPGPSKLLAPHNPLGTESDQACNHWRGKCNRFLEIGGRIAPAKQGAKWAAIPSRLLTDRGMSPSRQVNVHLFLNLARRALLVSEVIPLVGPLQAYFIMCLA
jgi:hypothetical protein